MSDVANHRALSQRLASVVLATMVALSCNRTTEQGPPTPGTTPPPSAALQPPSEDAALSQEVRGFLEIG